MKITFFVLAFATLLIGFFLGQYMTRQNFSSQFDCTDIRNFHADYLNKNYPNASQFQKNELNRQIKVICEKDPASISSADESIK